MEGYICIRHSLGELLFDDPILYEFIEENKFKIDIDIKKLYKVNKNNNNNKKLFK